MSAALRAETATLTTFSSSVAGTTAALLTKEEYAAAAGVALAARDAELVGARAEAAALAAAAAARRAAGAPDAEEARHEDAAAKAAAQRVAEAEARRASAAAESAAGKAAVSVAAAALVGARARLVAFQASCSARRGASHAANAKCRALDAIFIAAQADGAAFAHDFGKCGSLCRAARGEEALWSVVGRVRHGPRGRTALMFGARCGDVARVRWLIARGAPVDARAVASGMTALHFAAERGQATVASALLAAGASVAAANVKLSTPLHLACRAAVSDEDRLRFVRVLLDGGAPVNALDSDGRSPLALYTSVAVRTAGKKAFCDLLVARGGT